MESGVTKDRDLERYHVLRMVLEGKLTLVAAAEALDVSYRHAKRLKRSVERSGMQGLRHGNKGRTPANRLSEEVRKQVVELSVRRYSEFNDTHFAEMLAEREQIFVSRETVRAVRRAEGLPPKRKRRVRKHHRRRPRKASEGLMVLWDGSPHRWFGKEHDPCCLMAAIDDATSKVLALFFCEYEGSAAYLELLRHVVTNHGIPASIYQDRHSALKRNDDFWSIEEQLAGRQDPTQVGAALEALGIQDIFAQTPQAKGRVEKLFQTLQDRLVAMLRLEGITNSDAANKYVQETFLDYYNGKFAVPPEHLQSGWRKLPKTTDLERILSLRYQATVANDNAIRLGGLIIDIPPGPGKRSYAGVKAEVRQLLDGRWRVYHQNKLIATAPATELAEPIRAKRRRKGARAAVDTQWIYWASAPQNPGLGDYGPETAGNKPAHRHTVRRAGPGRTIGASRIA